MRWTRNMSPTGRNADDPASSKRLTLVFDRSDGKTAVFVDDQGGDIAVPVDRLPRHAAWSEGDVVRVPLDSSGLPRWSAAVLDETETARRKEGGVRREE
jgi:hypothetical protein